ncbi:MAG: chromosome condensation regulator [Dehalococcoidia bacterium]|nr:chromosome condensation regulator [Dehalococcoidia bacterium]MDH4299045.1 chromosome condensation regulator [Dehalococcoidia bacterium]MDH4367680.1 chromosome condensation regulator [Dehalococcoidia bacterium]
MTRIWGIKMMRRLKRCHYLAISSIFFIVVASIVGMVGCDGGGGYLTLTITSTEGGTVTVPGEGTFKFAPQCCQSVDLVAEADEGYRFVKWTSNEYPPEAPLHAVTCVALGRDMSITANFGYECSPMIAAGGKHTVGLSDVGSVFSVGDNYFGQCNASQWRNIVQVAAGGEHTVGVKPDGTVVAAGDNSNGQCNIGNWTGIAQVAAGNSHTVGLGGDHTVVAVGDNSLGQCNVSGWGNITQIAAGGSHTVGLKSDGTVVAVGYNSHGQCDVNEWTDIIQIATGRTHTVGVKSDGTVVAAGGSEYDYGQCDVGGWINVIQVAAGGPHTVGLKDDGTVIVVGYNLYGECDVGWMLIS